MLWKIEKNGFDAPSFLFGTMHVRDSSALSVAALAFEKIKSCKTFAAEYHLGQQHASPSPNPFQLPQDQTVAQYFPPKRYAKMRRILLKAAHFDLDQYQRLQPMLIVNLIAEHRLGYDLPRSLDEELWDFAQSEGLAMTGIETFAEQMEVLSQIPTSVQADMLYGAVRNIGSYQSNLLRMAELYKNGEADRLYQAVKKNLRGLRKLLLYRRNAAMAERIGLLAAQGPAFVAVGAAHMPGGKGVLRLLKKSGFKLELVKH